MKKALHAVMGSTSSGDEPGAVQQQAVYTLLIRVGLFIMLGSLIVLLAEMLIRGISVVDPLVLTRLAIVSISIPLLLTSKFAFKRLSTEAITVLLTLVYSLHTLGILALWWTSSIFATVLPGVTIALACITMRPKAVFYVAVVNGAGLALLHTLITSGVYVPPLALEHTQLLYSDIFSYCMILLLTAFMSWIAMTKVERSYAQAAKARSQLQIQKEWLAQELETRTAELKVAQLQETQSLYTFLELGQISTTLMHELANHITALNLQVESIAQTSDGATIARAKASIEQIDKIVKSVQKEVNGERVAVVFSVQDCLSEVVALVQSQSPESSAAIRLLRNDKPAYARGDPERLRQVISILVNNALESYGANRESAVVEIALQKIKKTLHITVSDWGPGLRAKATARLFKPFNSTKKDGMGLGLFMAQRIINSHFKGSVQLESSKNPTTFTVTLPAAPFRK